jgi:deazaflavin-dependent oxidoreductase (nitroreductase family)
MLAGTSMSVHIPPRGTRGVGMPPVPPALTRVLNALMFRIFRNRTFRGGRLLSLTTVGARSGQSRQATVAYFPDGPDAWLIVASAGGAATHPAWLFNLARNPDRVWIEVGNRKLRVRPETLTGEARAQAWQRITAQAPDFAGYETKTDREIPVVRLTASG